MCGEFDGTTLLCGGLPLIQAKAFALAKDLFLEKARTGRSEPFLFEHNHQKSEIKDPELLRVFRMNFGSAAIQAAGIKSGAFPSPPSGRPEELIQIS